MPTVDVLLATYNGARFLPELLASLDAQIISDWRLVIRDDGSSDDGLAIVENWALKTRRELLIVRDDARLGAVGSFSRLLDASDAPYFMFCDQDDVWLPEKIKLLLDQMKSAETAQGAETPILVHSDLRVVDNDLNEIDPSFWATQRFRFSCVSHADRNDRCKSLTVQNIVTGCATLGNAALRRLAGPIPIEATMHDWWVALVAGLLGEVRGVDTPTVLYRQHGMNTIGARDWGLGAVMHRLAVEPRATVRRTRAWLDTSRAQAAVFVERYADRLEDDITSVLSDYADLGGRSLVERKSFLLRNRVWPQSRVRSAIMLAIV